MIQQGSEEWHALRSGKITASRFGDVIASKGSKRYQQYLLEVVLELEGAESFDDDPPWMKPGKQNEEEGLGAYAFQTGHELDRPAFIQHPEHPYIGCSPDSLVNPDGGVELKCRSSLKSHLKTVKAKIDSVYKPQVQGCLWITGREWWDFASYYIPPNRFDGGTTDLHIHRVYPDKSMIARIETRCIEFWSDVHKLLEERQCQTTSK